MDYYQNQTKYLYKVCGKSAKFLNVKNALYLY